MIGVEMSAPSQRLQKREMVSRGRPVGSRAEWDNESPMPLGIYIAIPFCKSKCSYCNFASGVASRAVFGRYVEKLCADVARAEQIAHQMGGRLERDVDSVYLGGGTPTMLDPGQLEQVFHALRQAFNLQKDAEVTVECAPGTLTSAVLEVLLRCGVNRVSLGVQSWVDQEAAAVGRLHTRKTVLEDVARLGSAGIANINIDLIAGLPHQTAESWEYSLTETIACGAPHASVYILEVDEDSRLGRELRAGGTRYHAHYVPDDDASADFYLAAGERLEAAGVRQYEISNFARTGSESRHNLKYWMRQPYLGFGVDAHSMLPALEEHDVSRADASEAVRFSMVDELDRFLAGTTWNRTEVTHRAALEETFFLGLRLMQGVNLDEVAARFGAEALASVAPVIGECTGAGLLERRQSVVRLTPRGRLLSNEVFERFISGDVQECARPAPPSE